LIVAGLTIFLTGCARREYYSPVGLEAAGGKFLTEAVAERLVWPLKGQVVFSYGAREDRVGIKGIVIRADEGSLVRAAQDGRVSFVDESLSGYGRTVILEHSPDLTTVYARHAEILVKLGQWVRQGEPIAKIGRAGRGTFPQLYFEVRRRLKPEDPLKYLLTNA